MLLTLRMPAVGPEAILVIRAVHAAADAFLPRGTTLLDFSADLGGGLPHDCPPISHYRIIVREAAWLRRLVVGAGDQVRPGALLALLATGDEVPPDAASPDAASPNTGSPGAAPPGTPPTRAARVTVAGILHHDGWGSAG